MTRLRTFLSGVAVSFCSIGYVCAELQTYSVDGSAASFSNAWGQNNWSDFPITGTVDIEFNDSTNQLSFSNVQLVSGVWIGDFVNRVADFSLPQEYRMSLDSLSGEIRDDGTVFFQERPVGFYPPWEHPEPTEGELLKVYHPWFFGTGVEGLLTPDRQSMKFIKISDYTIADGGRGTVFLELKAVPEPSSVYLSLLGIGVVISVARTRRTS